MRTDVFMASAAFRGGGREVEATAAPRHRKEEAQLGWR